MEKLRFYRQTGTLDPTLNAMSRKGFTVKRTAFGFYLFSSCPPGEYTYQTVWTFGMKREERRQMIDRLSRSGTLNLGLQGSGWWLLGTVAAGVLCIWDLFSSENCRNRTKELTNRAFVLK